MQIQNHGVVQFKQPVSGAPADSISLSDYYVNFDADGSPLSNNYVFVNASGTWYSEVFDDSGMYGQFAWCDPASGSGSGYTTVYTSDNDYGDTRTNRIRFTRGSATTDMSITQYNY